MNDVTDMTLVTMPKTDQLNADSLIGGPITVTITRITIMPGIEQPVSVFYTGDKGKPYKPGLSMNKLMVLVWGKDAKKYIGRSMTLWCDPKVTWGGAAVGGIRISHMSDIKSAVTVALTATKGNKKPYKVEPLAVAKAEPARVGVREMLAVALDAATDADGVAECARLPAIAKILAEGPDNQRVALNEMMRVAFERFADAQAPTETGEGETPADDTAKA